MVSCHTVTFLMFLSSPSPPWWCSRRCQSTWFTILLLINSVWTWTSGWQDARKSATISTLRPPTSLAALGWERRESECKIQTDQEETEHGSQTWNSELRGDFKVLLDLKMSSSLVFLFCSCLLTLIWKWWLEGTDRGYWRYHHIYDQHIYIVHIVMEVLIISVKSQLVANIICLLFWRLSSY